MPRVEIPTWPWRNRAFGLSSPSRIAKSASNSAPLKSPSFSLQACMKTWCTSHYTELLEKERKDISLSLSLSEGYPVFPISQRWAKRDKMKRKQIGEVFDTMIYPYEKKIILPNLQKNWDEWQCWFAIEQLCHKMGKCFVLFPSYFFLIFFWDSMQTITEQELTALFDNICDFVFLNAALLTEKGSYWHRQEVYSIKYAHRGFSSLFWVTKIKTNPPTH